VKIKIIKPDILPGLVTIVICILFWKSVSLLFLPVFLPGPLVLFGSCNRGL